MRLRILIVGVLLCAGAAFAQFVEDGTGTNLGSSRRNQVIDGTNGGDVVGKRGIYGITAAATFTPTSTPTPTNTPTPTPTSTSTPTPTATSTPTATPTP